MQLLSLIHIFCIKLWKKEVYELLSREQKEKQRAFSPIKTCVKLMMGIILLAVAYGIGCGILSSELGIKRMFRMTAILCFCGVLGTFFFFQGLAYLFDRICRKLPGKKLWTCLLYTSTTIMVTHNLRYAVEYGNRLLMMHQGEAVMDLSAEEKQTLKVEDILEKFNAISIECGN